LGTQCSLLRRRVDGLPEIVQIRAGSVVDLVAAPD
jgi:hypothetical protein